MKTIFLDAGHSKRFSGARGFKDETSWNREIRDSLVTLLDRSKWNVILVPDSFWNDYSANNNLIHRIQWINKRGNMSDWLLSIHGNAAASTQARGLEIYFYAGSQVSQGHAQKMLQSVVSHTGVPIHASGVFPDTSTRFGRLGIVRDTSPLALLIECGFVTNKMDMDVPAQFYAQGIADYLNAL